MNERSYQFFRSLKAASNLNYVRFCDYSSLGQKNRKGLGIDGNMCFDYGKQWLYRVSVGSEFPSIVQEAALEVRVQLLMKVYFPVYTY